MKLSTFRKREYEVLKMDVVATGEIQKIEMEYGEETAFPERVKRYKFSPGPFDFALSDTLIWIRC